MKFVIIGSALSGNKGGAAMLESSVQTLTKHYPGAQFTLLSMYPDEDKKQNKYGNMTILKATPVYLALVINGSALMWRLFPFLRPVLEKLSLQVKALTTANVLLDQGGITFVDGREKFLLYNIASILPAIFIRTPVIKCAQALGPFDGKINNLAAKYFLPKMALIISRGTITHQHLIELGLKNVVAGSDYAFSLDITDEEAAKSKIDIDFFKKGKVVGISPSAVMRKKIEMTGADYVVIMAEFVNYLINKKGYRVALIPHSARRNTNKSHNNDLPLCRDIHYLIRDKESCLFIDEELDSQELRYIIGRCSLFVASRFHAMVSSLAMKVPTLVIGWSHKYLEVLNAFELEDWAFDYGKLTPNYMKRQFKKLEDSQEEIRQKLNEHLPEIKKKSLNHVEYINSIISTIIQ